VASSSAAAAALVVLAAAGASALIVQNKGGGHGEIGYHLALLLRSKNVKVTMIQDSAAKGDKPPFDSYGDLEEAGVTIKHADFANGGIAAALQGVAPCTHVFDNQNVCTKDVQQTVAGWSPKNYSYVSSGGMYKVVGDVAMPESNPVKEDNKQLGLEQNAAALGLPFTAFRPQYIYGPKTGKRGYLDWFLDRILSDKPIPLPADGNLLTTLTNAKDVAGMLASVIGNEEVAARNVFNCAADVTITHKEIINVICEVVKKNPAEVMSRVVYFDAKALPKDMPKEGKFPFRVTHFAVDTQKAQQTLGWKCKHTLKEDMVSYYSQYLRLGLDRKEFDRAWDEAVIQAVGQPA
jgi:nucleoside-diphosphate-sugar epimerase